jgi:hypothetical protein
MNGAGNSCANCKYWEQFDEEDDDEIGLCCRYPPQRVVENAALLEAWGGVPPRAHSTRDWSQPVTMERDWCGEFAT